MTAPTIETHEAEILLSVRAVAKAVGLPPKTVADRLRRFRIRPDFIGADAHLYRPGRPDVLAALGR